jgi:hypothetical protein
MPPEPIPTEVYDTYWRFAAERMSIYYKRLENPVGPWTDDPILRTYRFTNAYRAADRVSQYLIREVQYRPDRSQAPDELFFRTILFKLFNKIETWELIEHDLGTVSWQSIDLNRVSHVLNEAFRRGGRLYNAAYIMPAPAFGFTRKHDNHLALLGQMMEDGLPARLRRAHSLEEAYKLILSYRGLGPFLAFQYAIDLNYSELTDFSEAEFVVAGPGALDGIAKCFQDTGGLRPSEIIHLMVDKQEAEFIRLNLNWSGLFGRRLQPIDCQNLFCEISKFARVLYPHIQGVSGRTRIKQHYQPRGCMREPPFFPPKWMLQRHGRTSPTPTLATQLPLFKVGSNG